jgi:hypothetical protein
MLHIQVIGNVGAWFPFAVSDDRQAKFDAYMEKSQFAMNELLKPAHVAVRPA